LQEAGFALGQWWRQDYKTVRPHSALGYRPPGVRSMAIPPFAPLPLSALALGAGLN